MTTFLDGPAAGATRGGITKKTKQGRELAADVMQWATPQAFDQRACERKTETTHESKPGCRTLVNDIQTFPCSRPAEATNPTPTTPTGGLGLLLQRWTPPSCRALNSTFQHWLMGWPVRTSCESAETGSYPSPQRSRSINYFEDWRSQVRSALLALVSDDIASAVNFCGELYDRATTDAERVAAQVLAFQLGREWRQHGCLVQTVPSATVAHDARRASTGSLEGRGCASRARLGVGDTGRRREPPRESRHRIADGLPRTAVRPRRRTALSALVLVCVAIGVLLLCGCAGWILAGRNAP